MSNQNIFLSIGSNLGDRYKNIIQGIEEIQNHPHIWIIDKSYVYDSPPMYNKNQNNFYNMVISIETNLEPLDLLLAMKKIELLLGRVKSENKNMPRTLDIDILAFGKMQIISDLLELPHHSIAERKFVLKPWNDIAANYIVPKYLCSVSELLENTNDNSVVRMVLI